MVNSFQLEPQEMMEVINKIGNVNLERLRLHVINCNLAFETVESLFGCTFAIVILDWQSLLQLNHVKTDACCGSEWSCSLQAIFLPLNNLQLCLYL